MKKVILCFIFCSSVFGSLHTNAQTWDTVGHTGFTSKYANYNSIAMDTGGTPYIVYASGGTSGSSFGPAIVMKYNGSTWDTVGAPDFSGTAAEHCTMIIDKNGIPYVAYGAYDTITPNYGPANVMKFDGTNWVHVGSPNFSAGQIENISIAIGNNDTLYVAYMDIANGEKATVMKFNGSSWVSVGSPGFSASWAEGIAIALDTSGTPYVVYDDYLHYQGASVMKYSGGHWAYVGSATLSDTSADWPAIVIDKSGTPYVAYWDLNYEGAATVQKFDGTNWVFVGSPGFTGASATFNSLVMDSTGNPYIAFCDEAHGLAASVMKFNGSSWGYVGAPGISEANVWYTSIALNNGGTPYVTFADAGVGSKASVMKLQDTTSTTMVKNITATPHSLTIFPNPATSQLSITSTNNITAVTISNLIGQVIHSNQFDSKQVQVDVSDLQSGMYMIKINGTEVRKFIKE